MPWCDSSFSYNHLCVLSTERICHKANVKDMKDLITKYRHREGICVVEKAEDIIKKNQFSNYLPNPQNFLSNLDN